MPHLEPELIALLALGEPADADARAHLDQCPACAAELEALSTTVVRARAAGPGLAELVEPPVRVWDAIAAELDLPAHVRPGAASPNVGTQGAREPSERRAGRRRVAPGWLAAAAAAGIVVGGIGVGWWDTRTPAPTVIEQAALDALPDWPGASGTAVVERAADGTRELVVTLNGAGTNSGFHEVWLIDTEVSRLISLGMLHGDHGVFPLPDDLDLAAYPVVDISEEPFDGNPGHSGDSIVRGVLQA